MPEPMKKRHTDFVEIRIRGPLTAKTKAIKALQAIGFVEVEDSVPWRVPLDVPEDQLPGKALSGARYKEGLTQRALSAMTGIPQRHISEMENHKRPIGKEMAKLLGKALKIDYRLFL